MTAPDTEIVLLRHGETHWNRAGRYQGHRDSPLTLTGIAQIRAAALTLRRAIGAPDRYQLWCSPLGRAQQSMAVLCEELGLAFADVRFDARLMECAYGRWEGLTRDEIGERYPDDVAAREKDKWGFAIPGGESYAQVAERVRAWLEALPAERPALVLGHSGAGRILRGLYTGLDRDAVFAVDEPQSTAFVLRDGRATALPADPGALRRFGCTDAGLGLRL